MKLFDFDVDHHRRQYEQQGWIHIESGVTEEFLTHVTAVVESRLQAGPLTGAGLAGAKEQYLFDFPDDVDLERDLFDPVAELFGLDRTGVTLSERHLKMYDDDADPDPLPHKDRRASTISLGITIRATPATRAFLHPAVERSDNPFMAPDLLASLPPEHHPSRALDAGAAVEIRDRPGDVLGFPGSSVWHGRRDAAGVALLYLKFNDFGVDPLGEDPRHAQRLRTEPAGVAETTAVRLGPRLVSISDRAAPPDWSPIPMVDVWGRGPLQISALERQVVERATTGTTIVQLVDALGDRAGVLRAVDRLVGADVLAVSG